MNADVAWECPGSIAASCAEDKDLTIPLLFEASEFGQGTRFVDVAPWAVLAERDSGALRTISIIACGQEEWPCAAANVEIAETEVAIDAGVRAVALTGSGYYLYPYDEGPFRHVAVLCDDTSCALYGAALTRGVPDTEISAIPGGEVPGTAVVRGLWGSEDSPVVCAYGDGIRCYDGTTWWSPFPPHSEARPLNDMTAFWLDNTWTAIAVGDDGHVVQSGFPTWRWVGRRDVRADWHTVATRAYDGYAVAGEGGALAVRSGNTWHDCVLGNEDIVVLAGWDEHPRPSTGVTASGRVFVATGPVTAMVNPCFTGQVVGPVPRAAAFFCGISANLFLMNEMAVYGTTDCALE